MIIFKTLSGNLFLFFYGFLNKESDIQYIRSCQCGATGLVVYWDCWVAGLIPGPAQQVKDPALPQLWRRAQRQLGSDPWPGNSMCCGAATREKKKRKKDIRYIIAPSSLSLQNLMYALHSKKVQASQLDGLFQMNLVSFATTRWVFIMIIKISISQTVMVSCD